MGTVTHAGAFQRGLQGGRLYKPEIYERGGIWSWYPVRVWILRLESVIAA